MNMSLTHLGHLSAVHHRRLAHLVAVLALGTSLFGAGPVQAQNVDMGQASVLSQQGQRLKLALPFGIDAGKTISLLSFEVASVEAEEGFTAPAARQFTVSKPERSNVIYLQSAERVMAPNLKLVLAVAGDPGKRIQYDLTVPPASARMADAGASERSSARGTRPVKKGKAQRRARFQAKKK